MNETYCYVIQFYYADQNQRTQLAIGYTQAHMAVRSLYNKTWSSWAKVYTSGNKPTLSELGAASSGDISPIKTRLTKLEANVDVATLVTSGTFYTYGYDSSSNRYEQGIMFNHDNTSSSTIMEYYKGNLQSTTSATISPANCSFIVFKLVYESTIVENIKSKIRNTIEIKAKAGSEIRFSEKNDTYTFAAKISSDGKTVTITTGYNHGDNDITKYQMGWYECYA